MALAPSNHTLPVVVVELSSALDSPSLLWHLSLRLDSGQGVSIPVLTYYHLSSRYERNIHLISTKAFPALLGGHSE